jgi:ABC-type amino acid transport substrate-binding protein
VRKFKATGEDVGEDFFSAGRKRQRFMATDDQLHTSRIPPDDQHVLLPGEYAWRVRAVPHNTIVPENSNLPTVGEIDSSDDADAEPGISDWSGYGSFSVYRSILDRIVTTGRVRVGTNLEQNTQFARRKDGDPWGFDISLVRWLIEGCTQVKDVGGKNGQRLAPNLDAGCKAGPPATTQNRKCEAAPSNGHPAHLCVEFVGVPRWSAWQDALRRKDIDVFVGGTTAAAAREGSGLYFTPGYLWFNSRLYLHERDFTNPNSGIGPWLTRVRKVGVIESSSSLVLLQEIKKEYDSDSGPTRIEPKEYSSYPGLEAAMDRGEIDGMIVDDTFVSRHPDWKSFALKTLEPEAFARYAANFLGKWKDEQISMAVAVDEEGRSSSDGSLLALLSQLLNGSQPVITKTDLPKLCKIFWPTNTSSYTCGEVR